MSAFCRICQTEITGPMMRVKEMQHATLEEFSYMTCPQCGCFQISEIPDHMGDYYPSNYYSFTNQALHMGAFQRKALKHLFTYYTGKKDLLGYGFKRLFHDPYPWIKKEYVSLSSTILDVGCGIGERIFKMREGGFQHLRGIDPFIAQDIEYANGVWVEKKDLFEMDGVFDFITLHHSLEHMPDPKRALEKLFSLLEDKGTLLIRVPIVGGYTFRTYKENTFHIDAPRHLYLHSLKSLEYLAHLTGFEIRGCVFDTNYRQILASKAYQQGHYGPYDESGFSKAEIRQAKKTARQINQAREGDLICLFLQRAKTVCP